MTPEYITVHYPGVADFQARPVKIGAYCDKNPTLPISMQEKETESSRFLNALEKRHDENRTKVANAISFASFGKDGSAHV